MGGGQGEKLLRERSERVEFQVKRCRWKREKKGLHDRLRPDWVPQNAALGFDYKAFGVLEAYEVVLCLHTAALLQPSISHLAAVFFFFPRSPRLSIAWFSFLALLFPLTSVPGG